MALWVVRAGKHGEHENKFLKDNRVYATWEELNEDLEKIKSKNDLLDHIQSLDRYKDEKLNTLKNWTYQLWPFVHEMNNGDWVIVPSKMKPAIHVAEILSSYHYDPSAEDPYYHYRDIKWIGTDILRSNFDQDLLYSFGALGTIYQIKKNEAERRIKEMAVNGWKAKRTPTLTIKGNEQSDKSEGLVDLELLARDQIAQLISRKYKGHDLARLVEALLKAQGYTTFRSPAGPDKGIDILAAPGPLGFGNPRICVQVKSGDSPVDLPTMNQLIGTMQNVQADQGLLISWSGFKASIDREVPTQFFRVRLWDQNAIIDELFNIYSKLDEDIRAELPLKRIWALTIQESDE